MDFKLLAGATALSASLLGACNLLVGSTGGSGVEAPRNVLRDAAVTPNTIASPVLPPRLVNERNDSYPWPNGPFGHNCSRKNASATGDFDGDANDDHVRFYPAGPPNKWGFTPWRIRLTLDSGISSSSSIEADCPEAIGSSDIDGDGREELLYDTGQGMTAALVDVLRYGNKGLHNVKHRPAIGTLLYVGGSNAGISELRCYRTKEGSGLISTSSSGLRSRSVLIRRLALRGRKLVLIKETHVRLKRWVRGKLTCSDLHWLGY